MNHPYNDMPQANRHRCQHCQEVRLPGWLGPEEVVDYGIRFLGVTLADLFNATRDGCPFAKHLISEFRPEDTDVLDHNRVGLYYRRIIDVELFLQYIHNTDQLEVACTTAEFEIQASEGRRDFGQGPPRLASLENLVILTVSR